VSPAGHELEMNFIFQVLTDQKEKFAWLENVKV
jgi:hypothetical protein